MTALNIYRIDVFAKLARVKIDTVENNLSLFLLRVLCTSPGGEGLQQQLRKYIALRRRHFSQIQRSLTRVV